MPQAYALRCGGVHHSGVTFDPNTVLSWMWAEPWQVAVSVNEADEAVGTECTLRRVDRLWSCETVQRCMILAYPGRNLAEQW